MSLFPFGSQAENIVFPPNSGITDVTKAPYYADNTGNTDVSAILTRALLDAHQPSSWGANIVYLPNGTYMVRNTVAQKDPPYTMGPYIQGQSRKGTVIRLADGTWPTIDGTLRYVLTTGSGVAQCFNRGVRNLTVSVGRNNAGACGIYWFGNNQAMLSDVDVISEDGKGAIGFDAGKDESGPSMVRNVYVKGFDIGVMSGAINGITFYNIHVENQNRLGILVRTLDCPAWFDSVVSVNRVTAFRAEGASRAVLVDAVLTGGADTCDAIWNYSGAHLFARNVRAEGYRSVSYCPSTIQTYYPQGMTIDEFSSHKSESLFPSATRSLNLPRKVPPTPEWEQDMSKWANINDYLPGRTTREAFQAAIDDPAKTTVLVQGNHSFDGTVYVRGSINRIVGSAGDFNGFSGGRIEIVDGSAPAVVIQGIGLGGGDMSYVVLPIVQNSNRTLILESTLMGPVEVDGPGDVFMFDVVHSMEVRNANAHVWSWHFNPESWDGGDLTMSGGTVRLFGWKTEKNGTKVVSTGGTLEMLGFLQYSGCEDKNYPMIDISNTVFSMAMMNQRNFCQPSSYYETLVRETRNGETRELTSADNTMGGHVPLFIGCEQEDVHWVKTSSRPQVIRRSAPVKVFVTDLLGRRISQNPLQGIRSFSPGRSSTGLVIVAVETAEGRIVKRATVGF